MNPKRCIIPVFVPHLGCPNNCVFCNQRSISGQTEPATEKTVVEAISQGLERLSAPGQVQLAFYGGSFTAIPIAIQNELLSAVLPFFSSAFSKPRLQSIRISTRPDAMNRETLARLKTYHVSTIELGTQSMCNDVLQASGRGHTAEDTENAAELVKKHGFELIMQMMTGLPGDSWEKTLETAKRIIALKPDGVRIYPTVIVENTPLCNMWQAGMYAEHTVEQAVDWCAKLVPLFEKAGIPIIRLGLNPTEELSGGGALAGAYHPAFGELVYSRVLLERARELLRGKNLTDSVILGVNKSRISIMAGQHRQNTEKLKAEFGIKDLKIRPADIPKDSVILLC